MNHYQFDAIIIGGGIAGLWTLAQLKEQGFNVALFEKDKLGSGQSIHSQGIIHGGSKYALSGVISKATTSISDMPRIWQEALTQEKPLKLSGTEVLSEHQYLVPSQGIETKLLSFLGSKTMASHTRPVKHQDLPDDYNKLGLNTTFFELNEPVLNTHSLFSSFKNNYGDCLYQAEITQKNIQQRADGSYEITINGCCIETQRVIIASGEGNKNFSLKTRQQERPLQMVSVEDTKLPFVFVHFVGRSSKPVLTISSARKQDKTVWYLGGELAENGTDMPANDLINEARQLLNKLLPSLELSDDAIFNTYALTRAEPQQSGFLRPDDAFVKAENNIIYGWPTKLALAPRFSEQVLEILNKQKLSASSSNTAIMSELPHAEVADLPWNKA